MNAVQGPVVGRVGQLKRRSGAFALVRRLGEAVDDPRRGGGLSHDSVQQPPWVEQVVGIHRPLQLGQHRPFRLRGEERLDVRLGPPVPDAKPAAGRVEPLSNGRVAAAGRVAGGGSSDDSDDSSGEDDCLNCAHQQFCDRHPRDPAPRDPAHP